MSRALASLSEAGLILSPTSSTAPHIWRLRHGQGTRESISQASRGIRLMRWQNPMIPTVQTQIRETVARVSRDPIEISTPGTGEQRNRGTEEQRISTPLYPLKIQNRRKTKNRRTSPPQSLKTRMLLSKLLRVPAGLRKPLRFRRNRPRFLRRREKFRKREEARDPSDRVGSRLEALARTAHRHGQGGSQPDPRSHPVRRLLHAGETRTPQRQLGCHIQAFGSNGTSKT